MTFLDDTPDEFDRHDMEADTEIEQRAEAAREEDAIRGPTCRDCGAPLRQHPYAKFRDGRRVLACRTHGPRDSLNTVTDYERRPERLIAHEVNRTFDAALGDA